jgi:arylsulfatase A-like enzyme
MTESTSRPNLVLVMTDQHRFDALGIAGHPHVMTPNLDSLAHRGAWFRSAYSDCPTCIPARHCLLTGQKASTTGVVGFNTKAQIATKNTLPNLLRHAGYQTVSVGRSMHQHPGYERYGFEQVIGSPLKDRYSRFQDLFRSSDRSEFRNWPHLNTHGISPIGYEARPWPYPEEFHETNYAVNKAIEFLDCRDRSCPFFLYVGVVAPHPPLIPPACYYDRYWSMDLDEPVIGDWVEKLPNEGLGYSANHSDRVHLSGHRNRATRAGYYGLINHFDDQLNLLLTRLGMENEETYILFTSDHGEMLGDHESFRKGQGFEASAHVPMILNGPHIPEQTVIDRPVALSDILPTFMDLAGLETPESVDGTGPPPSCKTAYPETA